VITTVVVNPQEPFAVDSAGNLYLSIVTVLNSVVSTHIRKASNGAITYIAGNGTRGFSGDNGPALDAQLSEVSGLAVDSSGNVYVADTANLRIRVLTPIPVIPPPPSPDLTITQAHPGDFRQGQFGATYSITVGNSGNDPSNGTVTVTLADQTSQGLITTSMTGLGWTCTQPAGPCTRADALAPGTYHPAIRVTLNVALDAPATVISAASVAGGGETYVDNDTAFDFTVITTIPPRITSMSPNPASSIAGLQTIFINGSGFSNVIAVRITGPGGQSDLQFDAVGHFGIGQLSVKIDPGGTAATWTAQVILRNGQT